MVKPIRILLQTTIPTIEDDWSIWRFSLLQQHLASLTDENGNLLFEVTARDRATDAEGNNPILSTLGTSNFDELWQQFEPAREAPLQPSGRLVTKRRQR